MARWEPGRRLPAPGRAGNPGELPGTGHLRPLFGPVSTLTPGPRALDIPGRMWGILLSVTEYSEIDTHAWQRTVTGWITSL